MASYTFAVRGRGVFPFDMLRYDRCWPNSSEDATAMADPSCSFPGMRQVVLRSESDGPTPVRWRSFNWLCWGSAHLDPIAKSRV